MTNSVPLSSSLGKTDGTSQNRRRKVFSVKSVFTVPSGGAGGGIQAVQAPALGLYQVPLPSAGA